MREEMEQDLLGQGLLRAGATVRPGRYKRLDSRHVVELEHEDVLPAALDGHATCYTRIQIWNDVQPLDGAPIAAINEAVPAPVLSAALSERFDSRGEADFADRMLSALRYQFGGHKEEAAARKSGV